MKINIRNNAQLPNKYLRFVKWKIYNIQDKFQDLIYAEVFLNAEGQSPKTYIANVRLGIPGHDIILKNKSENLTELLRKATKDIHRYLAKNKNAKINRQNEILLKEIN